MLLSVSVHLDWVLWLVREDVRVYPNTNLFFPNKDHVRTYLEISEDLHQG